MSRPVGGSPGESYVPELGTSGSKAAQNSAPPEAVKTSSSKLEPKTAEQLAGAARTFGRLALTVVAAPVAVLGFAASVGMRMRETPKNPEAQKFSPMMAVKAEASSIGKDIKLTGGLFQTMGTVIAKPFQSKEKVETDSTQQLVADAKNDPAKAKELLSDGTIKFTPEQTKELVQTLIKDNPTEAGKALYDLDKAGKNPFTGASLGELSKNLSADQLSKVTTGVLSREIEEHRDAGNLLRLDSLGSKLIGEFSKNFLTPIISEQFTPLLQSIPKDQQLVVKDADGNSKLSEKCVEQTKGFVDQYLKAATAIVNNNSPEMNAFKEIVQQVEVQGNAKFGNGAGSVAGANLLFLRVLNPTLPSPTARGINVKYEGNQAANALVFSKVVQNMANNVEFGQKEQHMVPFNSIVKDNKEGMDGLRASITGPVLTKESTQAQAKQKVEKAAEIIFEKLENTFKNSVEGKQQLDKAGQWLSTQKGDERSKEQILSALTTKFVASSLKKDPQAAVDSILIYLGERVNDSKNDKENINLASKWLKEAGFNEQDQDRILGELAMKIAMDRATDDYSQYPKTPT